MGMENKGILYGVGVGPGDPELMTLKAVKTIRNSDVIILPAKDRESCHAYRIASAAVPELVEKELLFIEFPMTHDRLKMQAAHDIIYSRIAELLVQGKKLSLLTIGDPSVYSTYMYMHRRAAEEGFRAEMISGTASFSAVSARLGIALGEGSEEIHIIPASADIESTLGLHGTRVYMKSGKQLGRLIDMLENDECAESGNREGKCRYYAVSNCGMENEKVFYGLNEIRNADSYLTVVIVKEEKV